MSLLESDFTNAAGWNSLGSTLRAILPPVGAVAAAPLVPAKPQCACCEDAGYYVLAVPPQHAAFGHLHLCDCVAGQRHQGARLGRLARLSGLDAYSDKTFATFEGQVPGVQRVLSTTELYTKTLQGWLVLFGPYGCGKTHLAAATAHAALSRGVNVIFAAVPDLLDHLRATFAPGSDDTYDERFELLRTVDLLVLDDLGTESATPWAREKLYQLINHRYVRKLPLVVTSNVAPELLDGRIRSRLHDRVLGCGIITIAAADYRMCRSTSA